MTGSILVPLDGSRFAEQALPAAIAVAHGTGARLWLARVHVPLPLEAVPGRAAVLEGDLHRVERAYLRERVRSLAARDVRAEGVVLRGAVPSALRMAATSCRADLVVLASHRPPPFERVLYGSVADVLVRRSGVPVLLADGRAAGRWHVDRVLIPLDGSAESEAAVPPAFNVAGPVEYVLMHVDGDAGGPTMTTPPPGTTPATRMGASFDRVRGFLERRGAAVSVRVVRGRRPTAVIVEMAREADLIAMARRHCGPGRLLFGSTSDRVSRAAPRIAMLVFRSGPRPGSPRWAPAPLHPVGVRRSDGAGG